MIDSLLDHAIGILALIQLVWSVVLLWASWQIGHIVRSLAAERRELRRWKRMLEISTSHYQR